MEGDRQGTYTDVLLVVERNISIGDRAGVVKLDGVCLDVWNAAWN